tara:strand:+ start:262 stop:1047 length:786 start_codon:yes stop_codon:yes gene_type:complete
LDFKLIKLNGNLTKYFLILSSILVVSCKNTYSINLESIIDEYLYRISQKPLNDLKVESVKSQFEQIIHKVKESEKVQILYYLSEISIIQNKNNEAYTFINRAYTISHADSIYKQLEKIKLLTKNNLDLDSSNTELMWIKDSNNDLLMFNIQKNNYAASKKEKYNFNPILENVMIKGRAEVQKLYNQNKYNAAINKAEILIMMLGEIVKNDTINKELSQLYQDLAILYAKLNKLEESIEAINKAILLNPSTQNEEILTLIKK